MIKLLCEHCKAKLTLDNIEDVKSSILCENVDGHFVTVA